MPPAPRIPTHLLRIYHIHPWKIFLRSDTAVFVPMATSFVVLFLHDVLQSSNLLFPVQFRLIFAIDASERGRIGWNSFQFANRNGPESKKSKNHFWVEHRWTHCRFDEYFCRFDSSLLVSCSFLYFLIQSKDVGRLMMMWPPPKYTFNISAFRDSLFSMFFRMMMMTLRHLFFFSFDDVMRQSAVTIPVH